MPWKKWLASPALAGGASRPMRVCPQMAMGILQPDSEPVFFVSLYNREKTIRTRHPASREKDDPVHLTPSPFTTRKARGWQCGFVIPSYFYFTSINERPNTGSSQDLFQLTQYLVPTGFMHGAFFFIDELHL